MIEPNAHDEPGQPDPLATVLDAAVLLQNNGQSISTTLLAVDRLNLGLGIRGELIPCWSSLILECSHNGAAARVASLTPAEINMRRVAAAMRTIDRAEDGPLELGDVTARTTAAAALRPSNAAVFALACAIGAGALAVIFGADDARAVGLAAMSGAVGGVIRRALGRYGVENVVQMFVAAMWLASLTASTPGPAADDFGLAD